MYTQAQSAALEAIDSYYKLAEQKLNRLFPRPEINFKQRGKIAGSARLQHNQLRLNPILLEDNLQEFLHQVIPHEISHLLTYQLYGRVKPHGPEWQQLMLQVFRVAPKTTHNMDVSKVVGKTYPYQCLCGPVQLSKIRHNKVQKGQVYCCRTCGSALSASV